MAEQCSSTLSRGTNPNLGINTVLLYNNGIGWSTLKTLVRFGTFFFPALNAVICAELRLGGNNG